MADEEDSNLEYEAIYVPGPDGIEDLDQYQSGGYHPVVIGDLVASRYRIVHKLGSGAFAIVWLARDVKEDIYVALKIIQAGASDDSNELRIHQYLQQIGSTRAHVAALLDHCFVEGPNGRHLVLAFEVSGPSIASLRYHWQRRKVRPDVVRRIAQQTAQGLKEIHATGIVYGDLSAGNVLLGIKSIDALSIDQVYERFGHPEAEQVQRLDGGAVDDRCPRCIYEPINFAKADVDSFTAEVKFVDFAESYLSTDSMIPDLSAFTVSYSAPEVLFWEDKPTQMSDIWALACIWFELRSGTQLFREGLGGQRSVESEMIKAVGPLPVDWRDRRIAKFEAEGFVPVTEKSTSPNGASAILQTLHSTLSGSLRKLKAWCTAPFRMPSFSSEPKQRRVATSLRERIDDIGKWKSWCYMSIEERTTLMKDFNRAAGRENDEVSLKEVDTGPPPPGPLATQEAEDFEEILSSMLQFLPDKRRMLEDIMSHAWLNASYDEDQSEPWLMAYSPGLELEVQYQ